MRSVDRERNPNRFRRSAGEAVRAPVVGVADPESEHAPFVERFASSDDSTAKLYF